MVVRAVLLAALAFAIAAPAALASEPNLLRVLAGPLASARKSGAKVLLPSTLAAHAPHLYGWGGATLGGYDIQLASAPGCHDANACFVAEFTAAPAETASGAVVSLADGIDGRFVASACGASCNPARISWREFGERYAIDYIGTRRQLVALVDSAIMAGPR